MVRNVLAGVAICAMAACSSPEEMSESVSQDTPATPTAPETSGESAEQTIERRTAGGADAVNFEDNAAKGEAVREFSYAWPAEVSAIPALTNLLEQQRSTALAEQKAEWQSALREFGTEDCITCVNRGYGNTWKVVTDTPRFLSLSAESYVYTGGAHGNSYFDAIVWDREAGASISTKSLFTSSGALWSAVREDYCVKLDAARAERRGEYAEQDGTFGECPELSELTLLLGSSNGQTFNRMGLLAAPYVAGAYAEGPYEVNLDVTAAVLAAVKPEYRAAFSRTQ